MTPTNDAPVTVDPTGFEWPTEAAWQAMNEGEILAILANQRAHLAALASAPAGDGELPDRLPGHWDGGDGAAIARACTRLGRSTLCKGDLSDMALANAVYLAGRDDLDLIVWQTAAKERIRWLSAQLAVALARPRAAMGEQSREAVDAILQITNLDEAQIVQEPRFVLEMAQEALAALQSPPAKVEG